MSCHLEIRDGLAGLSIRASCCTSVFVLSKCCSVQRCTVLVMDPILTSQHSRFMRKHLQLDVVAMGSVSGVAHSMPDVEKVGQACDPSNL